MGAPTGLSAWSKPGTPPWVVDRPGHGRSPLHVETMGPMGPPFFYGGGDGRIYLPGGDDRHTQWPIADGDDAAMDAFIAGYGPMPADFEAFEIMDADRSAALLDRIGPAILLTHFASGPVGWLVADRRQA